MENEAWDAVMAATQNPCENSPVQEVGIAATALVIPPIDEKKTKDQMVEK